MKQPKRINCVSSPRNISTAVMYSFAQRDDTSVYDEPFYAHYLSKTGKEHPGTAEILASQSNDYTVVLEELNRDNGPVVYVKNMAHHMRVIPKNAFGGYSHMILIRDPRRLIASFAQIFDNPDMNDIGVAEQHALWQFDKERGIDTLILDTGELLKDPPGVLRKLCARLDIPFDDNMLSWNAGPRQEDGIWAKYWYRNVHASTGFAPQKTSTRPFPDHCRALLDEALPLYQAMFEQSIKA